MNILKLILPNFTRTGQYWMVDQDHTVFIFLHIITGSTFIITSHQIKLKYSQWGLLQIKIFCWANNRFSHSWRLLIYFLCFNFFFCYLLKKQIWANKYLTPILEIIKNTFNLFMEWRNCFFSCRPASLTVVFQGNAQ